MKKNILLLLLIFPVLTAAYTWDLWGPEYITTYDFYVNETGTFCELICSENGLYLYENEQWNNYSYGNLPIISAEKFSDNEVLVIMADGSWSDGIYTFNLITHEFQVMEWCYYPAFISFCETNGKYYVGYYYGLLESSNGVNWQGVEYFNGKYCTTFACLNEHLVIGITGNIYGVHYSDDSGENWYESETSPLLSDMIFYTGDNLYGIFPGDLDISGIWVSQDYGASWNQLYYSYEMKCIQSDFSGNIFVGWGPETYGRETGVGLWIPTHNIVEEMNEGLPNLDIYKLTYHPLIDCIHMIACTGWGVYMLNDYQVSTEDNILPDNSFSAKCYPNPFVYGESASQVTIFCDPNRGKSADCVVIYNVKGQLVKKLSSGLNQENYFSWDGTDFRNDLVDSGVYLYRINSDKRSSKPKRILFIR